MKHAMPMHGFTKSWISYIFWSYSIFSQIIMPRVKARWRAERSETEGWKMTHTYCFFLAVPGCTISPGGCWGQQQQTLNMKSILNLTHEGGWHDLIKWTMDLILQIHFFKKAPLCMKTRPTGMSSQYMFGGGDSLWSHLLDARTTHLQDAQTAWEACAVQCPQSTAKGAQTVAHLGNQAPSWWQVFDLSPGCCRWLVFSNAAVMCLVYPELSASEPQYFLRDTKLNKLQINNTEHDFVLSCCCFSRL